MFAFDIGNGEFNRHLHTAFSLEGNFIIAFAFVLHALHFIIEHFRCFEPLIKKPVQINLGVLID